MLITLAFAAAAVAALGTHAAYLHSAGVESGKSSQLAFNERTLDLVQSELDAMFDGSTALLDSLAERLRSGRIDPGNLRLLESELLDEAAGRAWIDSLAYGSADGDHVRAFRDPNDADGVLRSYALGATERATGSDALAGFSVDAQAWYRQAIDEDGPVWTTARPAPSGRSALIGRAVAVTTPGGQRGVLALEIALDDLGRRLAALDLAEPGAAFVMTPAGLLLADDSGQAPLRRDGSEARLLPATESARASIRTSAARALQTSGSFRGETDGDPKLLLAARHYARDGGPALILAVTVPRSTYAGAARASALSGLSLAMIVVAGGVLLMLLLARTIGQPLAQLRDAADRLAAGRASEPLPRSPIEEIDALGRAFNDMSQQLRSAQGALEARVRERTAALRLANQKLEGLSRTDELTGLPNRRRLAGALGHEWKRAARDQHTLSLVLCDIDWFRDYNERHGRAEGDKVLIAVAEALETCARRGTDLVARIGGEAFLFLLPDTDPVNAGTFAERAREAIEKLALPHADSPLGHITISCGVAARVPRPDDLQSGPMALMAAADRALKKAKGEGRNRVALAPPDLNLR